MIKKKYPTLKEVFLPEISKDVSEKYVSKMKNVNRKNLYKKLVRLSKSIDTLYDKNISPTKAAQLLKTFLSLNPEINPIKRFDTLGVKMFLHNIEKDSTELGKLKRYYENVIEAYIKHYL